MRLEVLDFINTHSNWEELLRQKPYCIRIILQHDVYDEEFILLSYSQTESDFSLRIVQECRGLILAYDCKLRKYVPVCVPFFKFFNYGEQYAAKIDWTSAQVQEKIDGSLIKIWSYNNKIRISTNNMIDAFKAPIPLQTDKFKTYGDLVMYALYSQYQISEFNNPNFCYMFELVSPYTRIVIPYKEIKLYYLGQRDLKTFEEINFSFVYNSTNIPKHYNISTLQDCIENAKKLSKNEEGYVVVDKYYNRIKVKSPAYVAIAHTRNNITNNIIMEIIRKGEVNEFINYFPEYTEMITELDKKYFKLCHNLDECKDFIDTTVRKLLTRKEQALMLQEHYKNYLDFAFKYLDNKIKTITDYINSLSLHKFDEEVILVNINNK